MRLVRELWMQVRKELIGDIEERAAGHEAGRGSQRSAQVDRRLQQRPARRGHHDARCHAHHGIHQAARGIAHEQHRQRADGGEQPRTERREEGVLDGVRQRPPKNDGNGISRIVRNPGSAAMTLGMEFTVMDAVATSPCTPPAIFE